MDHDGIDVDDIIMGEVLSDDAPRGGGAPQGGLPGGGGPSEDPGCAGCLVAVVGLTVVGFGLYFLWQAVSDLWQRTLGG